MPLLIALLLLPAIEIAGFVAIGPYLGVGGTLGFVLLSALLGLSLLRKEGIAALLRLRRELAEGGAPLPVALDGACRIVAALLLIVPGFVSSAIGLMLLVPPLRGALVRWLVGRFEAEGPGLWRFRPRGARPEGMIIEGEFRELRDREPPRED